MKSAQGYIAEVEGMFPSSPAVDGKQGVQLREGFRNTALQDKELNKTLPMSYAAGRPLQKEIKQPSLLRQWGINEWLFLHKTRHF